MRGGWLSRRAVVAHVGVLIVAPLCLVAGWWQISRARSGNLLSWAYAVEWPLFAVMAIVMWWQLLHRENAVDPPRVKAPSDGASGADGDGTQPVRNRDEEDADLRAYNDQLEFLAAFGRPKTWRNPKGMP